MTQILTNSSLLSVETEVSREPSWGPNGKNVYERTYQRVREDGTKESWHDTVTRVVKGNLSLVPRDRTWDGEREELYDLLYNFKAIPGGRHLWMSGVEGRQFLFNCYVSGWGDRLSDHFAFTFNQLMEGGGVGANYSAKHINYPVSNLIQVKIVCREDHPDFAAMQEAGLINKAGSHPDSFVVEDSREGWVAALRWIIDIAEAPTYDETEGHMELWLDVSDIREAGSRISTFGGTAAGPIVLAKLLREVAHLMNDAWESCGMNGPIAMEIDHAIANCVVSGNVRRSARMSIMHWNDPWIEWFLSCKSSGLSHWSTNISVEIDDEFISLLNSMNGPYLMEDVDLRKATHAHKVYRAVVSGMLKNGEPGFWNSSLANVGEPNEVISTNPCGEICLEGWENCNLGHINLASFVDRHGTVDYDGLSRAHTLMARFLIRATFGDITSAKTKEVVDRNRRIGVGHFGYAAFVAKQGIKFSESWDQSKSNMPLLLSELAHVVRVSTEQYAHQLRIPVPVKSRTVAPTGTIARLSGDPEGCGPIFARYYIQRIRYSEIDPAQADKIQEYKDEGYNVVPDPATPYTQVVEIPTKHKLVAELEEMGINPFILEDASEIEFEDHLRVQQMYQVYWADNAVSYTVNINPNQYSEEEVARTLKPFLSTLKGTTVFPNKGYELAPMERVAESDFARLRGSQRALGDAVDESCATGACPVR
jgi:ribonucleoside-triphosphate reductase (thioredoxin)